jgi:hypothetical protein
MLRPALACPYCYETYTAREIRFRCHCRLTREGKQCKPRWDTELENRRGIRREIGPVFEPDGRRRGRANTAVCPDCGGQSTYRICPCCHSQLPAQFGMIDSRIIGMAGAKESGKTVYMTVLLHELRNRIGNQYNAAITGADEETLQRFTAEYEDVIYGRRQLFRTTQRAAQHDGRVDPLVFRFTADPGGLRLSRAAEPRQNLLSFFDTAGEDFESQRSTADNARYLTCADGIMLLIDPLQLPGARQLAQPDTRQPGTGREYKPAELILNQITNVLLDFNKGGRATINKRVAVVFTKIDALWDTFSPGSPLRAAPPTGGAFDTGDSLDVHEEVRQLLNSWNGSQIDQMLHHHFRDRYRYFGVSALGRSPTADNAVSPSGVQPYRVADPLLWLLTESGALPKAKGRQ